MKRINLTRLILCFERRAVEWWLNPATNRLLLCNRAGHLFVWHVLPGHFAVSKYQPIQTHD